ncbi:MAG TPA: anti-sigma factor [Acidobacteriota bacterium]|nr:anti-sigma factor [Acidobacteriota bacterium]
MVNELNQQPETSNAAQPNDEDEATLVKRIAAGDPAALMTLYDRTNRLVYSVVLRLLGDAAVADEVLLDVYTDAWKHASGLDPKQAASLTWLTTIAATRAIDRIGTIPTDSGSPDYLRDLLIARIEREVQLNPPQPGGPGDAKAAPRRPVPLLTPPEQERSRLPWLAVIGLAIAALLAFLAWRQADQSAKQLNDQLSGAQADATNLRTLVDVQRARNREFEQIDAAISSRDTKVIHLQGQQDAPSASVVIFWETQKKRCLIDGHLPPAPDGKVYQLWFVLPRESISAGVIHTDPLGHILKTIDIAQDISRISAAAITLEPNGGSRQPTPPIFAMGKVNQ